MSLSILYYDRFDDASFLEQAEICIKEKPDGVVIVPVELDVTRQITEKLHELNIPFILLDSYMPDLKPLSFFGQDSFSSGRFAARMLMLLASQETEVALMKITRNGRVVSKQQSNREVGFRHYMQDHFPAVKIVDFELPLMVRDSSMMIC